MSIGKKVTRFSHGFSLTEWFMSLIIIAVLLFIGLPHFINFHVLERKNDLLTLEARLKDRVTQLHAEAILEGKAQLSLTKLKNIDISYGYPAVGKKGICLTLAYPQLWHQYTGQRFFKNTTIFTDKAIEPALKHHPDEAVQSIINHSCFLLYHWHPTNNKRYFVDLSEAEQNIIQTQKIASNKWLDFTSPKHRMNNNQPDIIVNTQGC